MMSDKQIDDLFDEIDNDKNGLVSFSEFMAAGLNKEKMLQEQNIVNVFK